MSNSQMVKVDFYGESLDCIKNKDGVFVSLKRMCENIGIDVDSQRVKLQSKTWAVTVISTATGSDGKKYQMLMLSQDSVPMWLATIDAERVAEHVRPKVELYQKECARVLAEYWRTGEVKPKAPRVAVVSAKSEAALLNAKVRFMKMMNEQVAEVTDGRNLSRDIIAVVRISILEQQVGISLKELLPVNVTRWEAPSDIAKRLGSTPHTIGCIISTIPQLAARGNIDSYCRAVTNKALHSDRIVESFQYTPAAVALIEAQFSQQFNVPSSVDRLLPD